MTYTEDTNRSIEFERFFDHPPEKVWRALTQRHLLAEWLMRSDFSAEVGHTFTMEASWGEVTGTVMNKENERRLSYTWNGPGLTSEVCWTLLPEGTGTRLRLDHTRIPAESERAYRGALAGWPIFLERLEEALADDSE